MKFTSPWSMNTEPKIAHVDPATRTPASAEPVSAPAPPPPVPSKGTTVPDSSVRPSELQKGADAGLASKGIFPDE